MILAAGRGERMRPLTDTLPKPLIEVGGKPLIVHHIERLAAAGIEEIVVNIAHLGHLLPETLGDGARWGVRLRYSDERGSGALESAGGIVKALPLLGDAPFLVVNGDVLCKYAFDPTIVLGGASAHLILVPNPPHHRQGDFGLDAQGRALNGGTPRYTFAGIGYYSPRFFAGLPASKQALAPLLRAGMDEGRVRAELYTGLWCDVGTPQRLQQARALWQAKPSLGR